MNKLERLVQCTHLTASLEINGHKNDGCSVQEYLRRNGDVNQVLKLADQTLGRMIETDRLVEVTYYRAPLATFSKIYHYDASVALNLALAAVGEPSPDGYLFHEATDLIEGILKHCKNAIVISVCPNLQPREVLSVNQYLVGVCNREDTAILEEVDEKTLRHIYSTNILVTVDWYPYNPVESYRAWDSNVEQALEAAFNTNEFIAGLNQQLNDGDPKLFE